MDFQVSGYGLPGDGSGIFVTMRNVGVQVTINVSQRVVISTFFGDLTDADLVGFASLIGSHPDFDPSF